jgi:hypothetical protein
VGRGKSLGGLPRCSTRLLDRRGAGSAEILNRALDLCARIQRVPASFGARAPLDVALTSAHRLLATGDGLESRSRLGGHARRVRLALRELGLAALELLEQRGHVTLLLRKPFLRPRDDALWQREAARDGDAIRSTGDALCEPVRRRERNGVELERRVDDAGDVRRELLERPEVGRRDRRRAACGELFENRPAECRPVDGIGAGSQLVGENEGVGGRLAKNLAEVSQVRAERR